MLIKWFDHILSVKLFQNELIFLFVIFAITALIYFFKREKRNFPPGPYGIPFVGYLPFITKIPHLKLLEISKRYGDIFSITLGSKPIIVLNSADLIKEAFLKKEFLGRPPYGAFSLFKKESPFFTSPIHVWKDHRNFVVKSMKDLGLGRSKVEDYIKEEIVSILKVLKSHEGKPVNFFILLDKAVTNIILAMVFGVQYAFEDPTHEYIAKNFIIFSKFLSQTSAYQIFPWINRIPIINNSALTALEGYMNVSNFFQNLINEHKKTLDPINVRDYVDRYLTEMDSRKKSNPNTTFDEQALVDSSMDLLAGGKITVHTSMKWCVYILAAYPEVQKRIQAEIFNVIGAERMPTFTDQKLMPYTQAFILEVQRWVTIVPLNVMHYTVGDTTLGGYDIPRDTAVVANFWAVHHDPKQWDEPFTFKPERFFAEDGKTIVKPPNYMAFSIGKRGCPGETMAYMEMFLFLASILQHFDVAFPEGYKPTFKSIISVINRPEEYEVEFMSKT